MRKLVVPLLAIAAAATILVLVARRGSFRSALRRDAEKGLSRFRTPRVVTETDLERLPAPVQRYLRYAGVVGRPEVADLYAVFDGDFARNPSARAMKIHAEQYSFFDPPSRFFLMQSPLFDAYHRYAAANATMSVKAFSLFPVVHARGAEMTRSETVTLFNDMCLLAPATLTDPAIRWEHVDARAVRAIFTNAGNTISAILTFAPDGRLIDFTSVDRSQTSDGNVYIRCPWSTTIHSYGDFHGFRLPSEADAVWHEPAGDFVYAHFHVRDIRYNLK